MLKYIATTFLLLCLSSYSQNEREDSKTTTIGAFNSLKVYSGLDVKLFPSDKSKIVIYGDHKDDVIMTLKGETLKLKLPIKVVFNLGYTYVELYHTSPIYEITMGQGSSIKSDGRVKQTDISLKAREESTIALELDVPKIEAVASSGGKLNLNGKAKYFDLKTNTGGVCEAKELLSEHVKVKLIAGSQASVNATEFVSAKITGGGSINVYGNPKRKKTKKCLFGKINFY